MPFAIHHESNLTCKEPHLREQPQFLKEDDGMVDKFKRSPALRRIASDHNPM